MTIRLGSELKSRLDKLSVATHRSKSFFAAEAVREFIELNERQIDETKAATKETNNGNFANEQEVQTAFNKWVVDGD